MTPTDRIKQEAEADFKNAKVEWSETYALGRHDGYIAGATAEHDRAKVLVDALEAIAGISMPVPNKSDMIEIAKKALEQWEEKEVTNG